MAFELDQTVEIDPQCVLARFTDWELLLGWVGLKCENGLFYAAKNITVLPSRKSIWEMWIEVDNGLNTRAYGP